MPDVGQGDVRHPDTSAWRVIALDAIQKRMWEFAEPMETPEATAAVDAVLGVVCRALENAYAPQLHCDAHPADVVTKLFQLDGHENIDLRRIDGWGETKFADFEARMEMRDLMDKPYD